MESIPEILPMIEHSWWRKRQSLDKDFIKFNILRILFFLRPCTSLRSFPTLCSSSCSQGRSRYQATSTASPSTSRRSGANSSQQGQVLMHSSFVLSCSVFSFAFACSVMAFALYSIFEHRPWVKSAHVSAVRLLIFFFLCYVFIN